MSFPALAAPHVAEALVWALGYMVVVEWLFMPAAVLFAKTVRPQKWEELKDEKGVFASNEQEEFPLTCGIGAQHTFSGTLVTIGYFTNDPVLVAHGMLCEIGWEVKDVICLFGGFYPYGGASKINPAIKNIIAFHHAPGIMSGIPLIVIGMHKNLHVQAIAASMIGAGGIGVMVGGALSLFGDFKPFKVTVSLTENLIFFVARFIIFPHECIMLLSEIYEAHIIEAGAVFAGFVFMMFFNVVIMSLKAKKLKELFSFGPDSKKTDAPAPKLARQSSSLEMLTSSAVTPNEARLLKQVSATSFLTSGE